MVGVAPFVVCPETLGPLERRDGHLWSPRAAQAYPIRDGLVFFAYPRRDEEMIAATMAEEHAWQGTAGSIDRDVAFLRVSAPSAADLINLASRFVAVRDRQPRAVELGAGSGWVSWLLAAAGYDTWMCDFEANSLAIGDQYRHPNLGEGRRLVSDARYAPFADETFDLVLLKEFAHHVADHRRLFAEANRVLRPGGIVALMEPTRSVLKTLQEIRRPDPHRGHVITWPDAYLRSLRRSGFEVEHQTAVYGPREQRHALMRRLRRRAALQVRDLARPDAFTWVHVRLLGGVSSVVIARKRRAAVRPPRPPMRVIDPGTLVIAQAEREAFRVMQPILEEAAQRLVAVG